MKGNESSSNNKKLENIVKLIREIKEKKNLITNANINAFIDKKYPAPRLLADSKLVEKIRKELNRHNFKAKDMLQKDNGEETLNEYIAYLDELLSAQNNYAVNQIIIGLSIILVMFLGVKFVPVLLIPIVYIIYILYFKYG